jgi:hypothetical protein
MNFNDFIIADGKIGEYSFSHGNMKLYFIDYCQNKFTFCFKDVSSIVEKGSVGFDLSDGRLDKTGNQYVYKFYDDDGMVLKITSSGCKIFEGGV